MKRLLIVLAVLGPGWVATAHADATEDAEAYFKQGDTAYNLGHFDEAVEWFEKAYKAWQQPEFLYNIAQSYRLGGNCKQALHFYKRFVSLKERDRDAPLSAARKQDIAKFITDLEDCAARTDDTAAQRPDGLDHPGQPEPEPAAAPAPTTVAVAEPDDEDEDVEIDEEVDLADQRGGPSRLSARAVGGLALVSAGQLDIPAQAALGLTIAYPLALGPIGLELGAGLSYSPVPYDTADARELASLLGVRAVVAASYPVTPRIALRGDLGLGVASLGGLAAGNPFMESREAGGITAPSLRVGLAADYALTPNLIATLSPFSVAYTPAPEAAYMDALIEINVLAGIGYRL